MSDEVTSTEAEQLLVEDGGLQATPVPPVVPLGAQLRLAREARGMSTTDVSHALKFSVRQIEALERDDFSDLQGNTFLRGFVRSYARFLRVDESPLLAVLQQEVPAPTVEVREVESMNAAMPAHTSSVALHPLRQGLLVVLLLAIVALLGWFLLPAGVFSANPSAGLGGGVLKGDKPAAAPSTVAAEGNTVVAPPAATVLPAESGETLNVAAQTSTAVMPDERQLSFSFADVSWVEVRDAKQNIILTGKFFANAQQVVRGKPPFQMVIGNANAVKLRYDDRPIDLQPYIRAEVARLTLDDNSK